MNFFHCVFLVIVTSHTAVSVSPISKYLLRFPGEADHIEESQEVFDSSELARREQCRCDTLWSVAADLATLERDNGLPEDKNFDDLGIKLVTMKFVNKVIPRNSVDPFYLPYLSSCRCDILLRYLDKIIEVRETIKEIARKKEEEEEKKKQDELNKIKALRFCNPTFLVGGQGTAF